MSAFVRSCAVPPASQLAQGRKILVVDDHDTMLKLLTRALERNGLPVLSASCYDSALDACRKSDAPISGAVIDFNLGRSLDGLALFAQLRAELPFLQCLLISGLSPGLIPDLPHGCTFLPKPFSLADLLRSVARFDQDHPADPAPPSLPASS